MSPTETVSLDHPLTRGPDTIGAVSLRRPSAGDLRGLQLGLLMQMDVDAVARLLPRISQPTLTEHDVRALDPADLAQLAITVAGFFVAKKYRDLAETEAQT